MTERTFESIKGHAADRWTAIYEDATPLDVFPVGYMALMRDWLRKEGFPVGSIHDLLELSRACSERARGLRKARAMVERA